MRYVFWRMMKGEVITDAIREIHWDPRDFWRLVDIEREGKHPFKEEYSQAKILQSRAIADSIIIIAEGRDRTTRKQIRRVEKIVDRAMRKINRTKSAFERKMLMVQLLGDLREHDKIVMTRNKMQMDAAKWFAAKVNPNEFADQSKLGLGGLPLPGDGDKATAVTIAFIAPDGSEVPFDPTVVDPGASDS